MKILVINSGSSSIKFKLFNMKDYTPICFGLLERIGEKESSISLTSSMETFIKKSRIKNHAEALEVLFKVLFETDIVTDFNELYGVGHRVVHGGENYSKATIIDNNVIDELKKLIPLAPLHNPANIAGIEAIMQKSTTLKQVAIFDTAFHQSMPESSYLYALPYGLYEKDKIRRYGFHGTSHEYILKECAKILQKDPNKINIISLHLGNGASVCAIKNGKSIDTSMGFTPLEGLIMGTRCGDIDAAIIFYLHTKKGYSIEKIDTLLNKQSGLLGICNENDMRSILENEDSTNRYRLALEMYVYRIKKYIGSYMAILQNVDAIVFTGGIGEHSQKVRQSACDGLEIFNIILDKEKNSIKSSTHFEFHKNNSKTKLLVIPTDEELEIAIQTKELLEH